MTRSQEESREDAIVQENDTSMLINLTSYDDQRNAEEIDPEPPPFTSVKPRDQYYEELLKKAIELNDKTKNAGKNMCSSIIPVTILCKKRKNGIWTIWFKMMANYWSKLKQ